MYRKEITLEQHENYIKQTYRNRCNIYAANGVMPLTIPIVKKHGTKIPIRDVRIDYATNWQHLHWRAIMSSYNTSPFFEYYVDDFHPFYEKQELFLFDLNEKLLRTALALIGLSIDLDYTKTFENTCNGNDFRYTISPKIPFLEMDEIFKPQPYYQVFASRCGFAPNLSILDLLCNEGPNSLSILQTCISSHAEPSGNLSQACESFTG
jgi:hypothetical protein